MNRTEQKATEEEIKWTEMTAMAYGLKLDRLEAFWHYARFASKTMDRGTGILWAIIKANEK